jgi:hypothetical protein
VTGAHRRSRGAGRTAAGVHRRLAPVAALLLAACTGLPAPPRDGRIDPADAPLRFAGRLTAPGLAETSGLVRLGDRLIAQGDDSGPRLFVFAPDGSRPADVTDPVLPDAAPRDPEDLARLGEVLWLADTGNNRNVRRDLALLGWTPGTGDARRVPVDYPDQSAFPPADRRFDAEALFADDGVLWLLTKHRAPAPEGRFVAGTRLYRIDPAARDPVTEPVGRHDRLGPATAADVSPDGAWLAVLTYTAVWFLPRPADGDWLAGPARIRALPLWRTRQVEALAWTGPRMVLIADENGRAWTLEVDRALGGARGPTAPSPRDWTLPVRARSLADETAVAAPPP